MDDKKIQGELEALAVKLGMTIRYEPLKIDGSLHTGGYCRIRGQDVVIINKKASTRDKIHVLADALRRCDLKEIYILPSVRKILEGNGE
ncbi:MAG: hypothetical protein CSYNP_01027 [Syntrophus sp. SKADARSKE-3]|nr:hypothetical protein [Syntrophus sp. SKADARSKE-3]